MANNPFHLGTISFGTLRTEDLIRAFAGALDQGSKLANRASKFDPKAASDDEAMWLLEDLKNALEETAPPYCYFGAVEGDGSDFGFWIDHHLLLEGLVMGDLLRVGHIDQIPRDYDGQALLCAQGRMTLCAVVNGKATEIWTDALNRA